MYYELSYNYFYKTCKKSRNVKNADGVFPSWHLLNRLNDWRDKREFFVPFCNCVKSSRL